MQDYNAAAIDTALQIHLNQPEGGWLGLAGGDWVAGPTRQQHAGACINLRQVIGCLMGKGR